MNQINSKWLQFEKNFPTITRNGKKGLAKWIISKIQTKRQMFSERMTLILERVHSDNMKTLHTTSDAQWKQDACFSGFHRWEDIRTNTYTHE